MNIISCKLRDKYCEINYWKRGRKWTNT